jgi:FdhE protein
MSNSLQPKRLSSHFISTTQDGDGGMADMQAFLDITPEAVNQAAEAMIAAKPAYRDLIVFYGRIFAAQEDARQRIRLEPVVIPEELLTIRRREQLPLVPVSGMAFDPAAAGVLLGKICGITIDCGTGLSNSARVLSAKGAGIMPLFRDFLDEDDSAMARAAEGLGVDPPALAFFLYHSLRPALRCCARQLSGFLTNEPVWEQGYCPICGSPPGLSCLEGDGERSLFCSFCWHKWPLRRLLCPFCGNRDSERLLFLYSEEEPEYRVDACASCRKYIKTVDTRALARSFYSPLEQIASLHLDIKAVEEGYAAGIPISPPS